MRAKLLDDARRSTVAIDPAELAHLTGTPADLPTRSYAIVKDRLRQLRAVNPDVRFVYLFRFKPELQKMVFLADSSEVGAADGSLPGDDYARAAPSPGLQKIIRTGQPVTEGPRTDKFGTWVTAYASFARAPAGPAAASSDFLGLDIDAAGWRRELWQSAFERAFYVWVALGLPLVAWFVARWQMAQRHVIRNLSEAVEQSHSAIVIIGIDGRIEFANRGLIDQVGFNRSELIGRTWRDFHAAETSADVITDLVATVRSGRPWEGEWFTKRQNGTVYPVHGVVTPVNHSDGSLACFVAVFDDVTVTKQRESELRDARDRAQAGDRAKGQFLATMSHEVRTPLNGIVGFTSLLLETPLTAEQREYVQTIRMSTEALIQLTGDILDFARIESGKLTLDALACDPRECIEDVLDLLAPRADAKRIELLHRVAEDVPAAVDVDAGRLRQVLTNLIGNAIKFTDRGEVSVNLRRLPDLQVSPAHTGPDMCTLEFTVRDTGIGIAPENHPKLFRAFSQVDESTTRRYSGTGLGLAISRNLVELMGGTIELTSELGRGTTLTFTIRAPVAKVLPPMRSLAGLRLGLALRPGPLRNELADLVRGWRGDVVEADDAAQLGSAAVDIVLVDVRADAAEALAAQPSPLFGFEPEKIYGLVPMTLASELRTRLRAHFRLLVNKPVHHDSFFALLAGSVGNAPVPRQLTHFGFRVLVVEDNAVNQRLVQRVLSNLGCTPTAVDNGRQALDLLSQRAAEFDVVLLDLHMPEIDGIEALHEIRAGHAGPEAQKLWIIALTADAREEQRARGISEGLNDYLTKPLKPLDLEAAFKKLRTHRLTQER
jgi:PAS domain S-box-containing protein